MAKLFIITGPTGVGKTTVSKKLAQKLNNTAILEGDSFYAQVTSAKSPWEEGNHIDLMLKNLCDCAWNYLGSGYDVIINYVFTIRDVDVILNSLAKFEIHLVVLSASEEVIISRDREYFDETTILRLKEHILNFSNFPSKHILDVSNISVEEEIEQILSSKFKVFDAIDAGHLSGLSEKYFNLILSGQKTIELRVNDEKRQKINVGDRYVFGSDLVKRDLINKVVEDKVTFSSLDEVCASLDIEKLGFKSKEDFYKCYTSIYSDEEIQKYGIVAFYLK